MMMANYVVFSNCCVCGCWLLVALQIAVKVGFCGSLLTVFWLLF